MLTKSLDDSFQGIRLFQTEMYRDNRGYFMELYNRDNYYNSDLNVSFVQDNLSHSKKNVIRGLHYQLKNPQGKLISVLKGEIFDVFVDIRIGSPDFGKWKALIISAENRLQIYIPEGFAHGFCVLSETADVIYKCTKHYNPDDEYGINFSDQDIGIHWPISEPVVSDKDHSYKSLKEVPEKLLPVYL